MAKRRGISISLAAKCQLLFGLAVLVIIAGALAVPWQRMEQLAKQPNSKAARFAADLLFREVHTGMASVAPPSTAAATADASGTRPTMFIVTSPSGGFAEGPYKPDAVSLEALQQFRDKPQETDFGKSETLTS